MQGVVEARTGCCAGWGWIPANPALPLSSPLLYPELCDPTEPTDPAGDGVGDRGDGVPCPCITELLHCSTVVGGLDYKLKKKSKKMIQTELTYL
jgi:hypothetical protein